MSKFGGLWKHEYNQHALVPPKTEYRCRSGGGIQNGDIRYPSSCGGTAEEEEIPETLPLQWQNTKRYVVFVKVCGTSIPPLPPHSDHLSRPKRFVATPACTQAHQISYTARPGNRLRKGNHSVKGTSVTSLSALLALCANHLKIWHFAGLKKSLSYSVP